MALKQPLGSIYVKHFTMKFFVQANAKSIIFSSSKKPHFSLLYITCAVTSMGSEKHHQDPKVSSILLSVFNTWKIKKMEFRKKILSYLLQETCNPQTLFQVVTTADGRKPASMIRNISFALNKMLWYLCWHLKSLLKQNIYFGGEVSLQQLSKHSTVQSGFGSTKKATWQITTQSTSR